MPKRTAAQRAAGFFWATLGSSMLVVLGIVLLWLDGSFGTPGLTGLVTCHMLLHVWSLQPSWLTLSLLAALPALGLLLSGGWAGVRVLAAWARTRRLLAASVPYHVGVWPALDAALAAVPRCRHRVRVLPTTRPVACTAGVWRPRMLLSTGLLAHLVAGEISAVLGHEWGHVCSRDSLRVALLQWCSLTLWWIPIVRVWAEDSRRAMEEAADDVAVALTRQPLDLAAALVKTAQAQAIAPLMSAPVLGEGIQVTERVERLLDIAPARPRPAHRPWAVSALLVTGLCVLLLLPRQVVVTATPGQPLFAQLPVAGCHMPTP